MYIQWHQIPSIPPGDRTVWRCRIRADNVRFLFGIPKHTEFDHHDAVNRMEIRLKTRRHVIPASRFVVKFNIEGAPVYDVA